MSLLWQARPGFVLSRASIDPKAPLVGVMLETASAVDTITLGLLLSASIAEAASASDSTDSGVTAAPPKQWAISASRAGLGSVVVTNAISGSKTQVISNVGVVR